MSDNKWTPEPWPFYHEINAQLKDFAILTNVDYNRCRECVNALSGVENPKEYLETLLKQREEMAEQVKKLTGILNDATDLIMRLQENIIE